MPFIQNARSLATAALAVRTVHAGLDLSSGSNVAVYWGQNSYNQGTGSLAQQTLATYCASKYK